jgi:hypothetical protein
MKLESLVIAGQHTAVNTFPSLVLNIEKCFVVLFPSSLKSNLKKAVAKKQSVIREAHGREF